MQANALQDHGFYFLQPRLPGGLLLGLADMFFIKSLLISSQGIKGRFQAAVLSKGLLQQGRGGYRSGILGLMLLSFLCSVNRPANVLKDPFFVNRLGGSKSPLPNVSAVSDYTDAEHV